MRGGSEGLLMPWFVSKTAGLFIKKQFEIQVDDSGTNCVAEKFSARR